MEVSTRVGAEFVITELELALTFCRIAAEATDAGKRARNIEHGKKAYKGAIDMLRKLHLDDDTTRNIEGLTSDFKQALAGLGEQV
jgi:hypothetical protein